MVKTKLAEEVLDIEVVGLPSGRPWVVRMPIKGGPTAAPAVACTAAAIARVFDEMQLELTQPVCRPPAKGPPKYFAQGPPGAREYLHTVANKKGEERQVWRKFRRTAEKGMSPYSRKMIKSSRPAAHDRPKNIAAGAYEREGAGDAYAFDEAEL